MRAEKEGKAETKSPDQSNENVASSSSIMKISIEIATDTPLIDHYVVGYRNFNSGQRSLFTVENPTAIFSLPELKPATMSEHIRMERGNISLLYTMCSTYFKPYDTLPHQAQVHAIFSMD
jgi:hypothetical protein